MNGGDQPFSVHFVNARLDKIAPRQDGSKSDEVQIDPASLAGHGAALTGDGDQAGSVHTENALLHGRISIRCHPASVQTVNDFAAWSRCGTIGAGLHDSSVHRVNALLA
jgi:hypothetical protein